MKRRRGIGEQFPTAPQVDPVIGLSPVSRAAPHRHQTISAQSGEMVGNQALRLADQAGQLAHGVRFVHHDRHARARAPQRSPSP
jgi:hypothetical protein